MQFNNLPIKYFVSIQNIAILFCLQIKTVAKSIELNVKDNPRGRKSYQPTKTFFDDMLYDENRFKIERTNAWMDAYKGILVRF